MTQKKPEWLCSANFLIIDYIKDGVVLLDLKGRIIRTNKSALDIGGYTKNEIEGKGFRFLKMFPPKSIAKMLIAYKKVLSGQNILPFDVEFLTKNGDKKILEIFGNLVKIKNKPVGVVVLFRDITEQKKSEKAEKKRAQEMERFNKLAVGRELKMIQLKKKIKEMESRLKATSSSAPAPQEPKGQKDADGQEEKS